MFHINQALKCFCFMLILAASMVQANTTDLNDNIQVVTSFSILEDLVRELGGEHVEVVNLVDRNSDAHMYQPKPSDGVAISKADLVVFNGLGFEGWMTRLIQNSGYAKKQLVASAGVDPISHEGELDPHAWQSFSNIRTYINNITEALRTIKPQYAGYFSDRKAEYLNKLEMLEGQLTNSIKQIPISERVVVTGHDAFGYLGREYDIQFMAPMGLSMESEASAEDVSTVINQIRKQKVSALFIENVSNPRLLEQISAETGVGIGGRLYSDALSEMGGPANSYLNMMRHNLQSMIVALAPQQ